MSSYLEQKQRLRPAFRDGVPDPFEIGRIAGAPSKGHRETARLARRWRRAKDGFTRK